MTKTKRQKDLAKLRKLKGETRATKKPKASKRCGCVNRGGGDKVMHKSEQDAVEWMLRHLRKSSGFTLYRCPKKPGIYHVATDRRRR